MMCVCVCVCVRVCVCVYVKGTGLWDSKDCHNPTVHKIGDEYVVFYIGVGQPASDGNVVRADVVSDGNVVSNRLKHSMADLPQSIGAAYSASPDGPWIRMDQPLLKPEEVWECGGNPEPNCGVSNPAVSELRLMGVMNVDTKIKEQERHKKTNETT